MPKRLLEKALEKAPVEKRYTVEVIPDEAGWYVARAPELDGCHTQGRSIAQAVGRLREAMTLYGVKADAPISISYKAPIGARVRRLIVVRSKAEKAAKEAQDETQRLALDLVKQGLSVRDVGELLGVSHQRVQQLVKR